MAFEDYDYSDLAGTKPPDSPPVELTVPRTILRQLMFDLPYAKEHLPVLKAEYFNDHSDNEAFRAISTYIATYDRTPSKEELIIDLTERGGIPGLDGAIEVLKEVGKGDPFPASWIAATTQEFVRAQHFHTSIIDAIDAERVGKPWEPLIEQLLNPVSFKTPVKGLDSRSPDLFERLRRQDTTAVIPFDIARLNNSLRGARRKSLNMILGSTSAGKSLFLCHLTASYLRRGLNVLYFNMEMDDIIIERRVFANLFDLSLNRESGAMEFEDDDVEIPDSWGRMFVQAYPGGTVHAGDFRSEIAALKTNSHFVPDVVVVDYLGICASETLKPGTNNQLYSVGSAIAKELRALAHQTDTVVWTGLQANRSGTGKDVEVHLTHTADSFQITNHADIILAIWVEETLPGYPIRCAIRKHQTGAGAGEQFMLTVDRSKMRLYDVAESDEMPEPDTRDSKQFKSAYSSLKKKPKTRKAT
jgi:hypothetical protein